MPARVWSCCMLVSCPAIFESCDALPYAHLLFALSWTQKFLCYQAKLVDFERWISKGQAGTTLHASMQG